jgi:hypothetical protein
MDKKATIQKYIFLLGSSNREQASRFALPLGYCFLVGNKATYEQART